MNLVRGLVFFWWFVRFEVQFWRMNLCVGGLRFGIFRFVPIPNGKFTHVLIFYAVRTFGLVRGLVFFGVSKIRSSVSEDKPRFRRFEVHFSEGSGSLRFSIFRFIPSLVVCQTLLSCEQGNPSEILMNWAYFKQGNNNGLGLHGNIDSIFSLNETTLS